MKTLVLVPDPATAYGFKDLIAALPSANPRVIAYGSATSAALDAVEHTIYPIRDGSRLPSVFLEALVEHEQPDVILAPAGSIGVSSIPVLLIDLDPRISVQAVVEADDAGSVGWVEAVTGAQDRRPPLLRAGLFSVDYLPDWFAGPGKLAASAAPQVQARLADLANLSSFAARGERRAGGMTPASSPITDSSPEPAPTLDQASHSIPIVVLDEPAFDLAVPSATPIITEPAALAGSAAHGDGASSFSTSYALDLPTAPPASPAAPVLGATEMPTNASPHDTCMNYRGRHGSSTALVLASLDGLDALTPSELAHATVIATPETLAWLTARMGLAQFVCVAQEPRASEAIAALSTARTVIVHSDHLSPETLAPRARGNVSVVDLSRRGGPSLGWSDELQIGFFPAGGDAALALQWALWIGAREVIVAGQHGLETRPGWPQFWKGVKELLTVRGVKLAAPVPAGSGI